MHQVNTADIYPTICYSICIVLQRVFFILWLQNYVCSYYFVVLSTDGSFHKSIEFTSDRIDTVK